MYVDDPSFTCLSCTYLYTSYYSIIWRIPESHMFVNCHRHMSESQERGVAATGDFINDKPPQRSPQAALALSAAPLTVQPSPDLPSIPFFFEVLQDTAVSVIVQFRARGLDTGCTRSLVIQ